MSETHSNSTIQRRDVGPVTVLTLSDMDEIRDGGSLKHALASVFEAQRWNVILDLGEVSEVSSAFMGVLISATYTIRSHGGRLKLVGLQPKVSMLFSLTRLARIYEIFDLLETALRSFGPQIIQTETITSERT